ncbi:MAG: PD40 domain-containing protein [Marinilabiliaceae bacterium]|nr:PD40 domain-containing protein [Marinilabiliaceae bacterium]
MIKQIYSYSLSLAISLMLFASCVSHPDVPSSHRECQELPAIFPDYCDVTVPCNIAPLNFMLPANEYSKCVARITTPDGVQQTYGKGVKVQIPISEWRDMLNVSKGKSLKVEVWGEKDGEWLSFAPFDIRISNDSIDEYISYRLIEPTYVAWAYMEIAQRNLSSFEESQIFNNEITSNDKTIGQCINCHSYQNYKTDNMLFHVRLSNSGTVIVNDGKISRVNLKRDYTISSGVYPSWHPTAKLIAFSTNLTRQAFHTQNLNKIEVYDLESDLILYDVVTDSVSVVSNDPDLLEVYPTWSADGNYLYYCKSVPLPEELRGEGNDIRTTYQKVQYNLYRKSFDVTTHNFGEEELVYDAASQDKSVTVPRVSPDGRFIMFAQGQYGCFHTRHSDSDVYCMPLEEGEATAESLTLFNSEGYADTYPSWSSNGKWIMCSSRRYDGTYSRLYISHFTDGKVTKPFLLPQEDPEENTFRLKCYNRPEFMIEPVTISVEEFSRVFPD